MFRRKRFEAGERIQDQCREGCDGYKRDQRKRDGVKILLTLQPYPLLRARHVRVLAGQLCGEVVVGEVGIELLPCMRQGVEEEIKYGEQEDASFYPDGVRRCSRYAHVP